MDTPQDIPLGYWLYASEITIPEPQRDRELASIVEVSRDWNQRQRITGCLIASSRHFSQWIEGPPDQIQGLREKISSDPRHRALVTIEEGPAPQRQFAAWSLGYFGPSHFVGRVISRPLQTWLEGKERGLTQLRELMQNLSLGDRSGGILG